MARRRGNQLAINDPDLVVCKNIQSRPTLIQAPLAPQDPEPMKLKLKTVTVTLATGQTAEYATKAMLEHIVRNGREFGKSREAAKVAQGIRILNALGAGTAELSGDLSQLDGEAVKRAVAKPSAGWGAYPVTQTVVTGRNEDGSAITRSATRMLDISAIDLYPLIDGVLTS